jgi:hypothetical protein
LNQIDAAGQKDTSKNITAAQNTTMLAGIFGTGLDYDKGYSSNPRSKRGDTTK